MNEIIKKSKIQSNLDYIHYWYSHYRAYLNRNNIIDDYLKTHKVKKLHLGCGLNIIDMWLNSDLIGNDLIIPIDLNKKLPIKNSSFDFVYSEHVLEHFDYIQGRKILCEIYRILKQGSIVRLAIPDLKFIIGLYKKNKTSLQKNYIRWAIDTCLKNVEVYKESFVINNFFRAWGHQFIYDYDTLKLTLEKIGFKNIKKYKPGESKNQHLKGLELHWKVIGKDFNNLETVVIEANKPKK